MKAKMLGVLSLLVCLVLLGALAVAAQGPDSPTRLPRRGPQPQLMPFQDWDGGKPFPRPDGFRQTRQVSMSAVDLGQPGLSFRYVQTFGETEVAYNADTSHLNYPYGIGTVGNSIWIGEDWGNRVLKYDDAGNFQTAFGTPGFPDANYDTYFWEVPDVAEDGAGNIWVVDSATNVVVELNSLGQRIFTLGEEWVEGSDNTHFIDPMSVAFDAAGNIYVSDGSNWWNRDYGNQRVQIFDSSGTYLATIGQTGVCGSGNYQLCAPRHVAIDGNRLYVADAGNDRAQIFDITTPAAPVYVATIHGLSNPSGVAVDATYIYVADAWNDQVKVFNRNTYALVATIGTGWGSGNDQFKNPSDVAVDAAGRLYVADFVNTRVQQFTYSGGTWTYARTYGVTGVPYITDGNHYNRPSGVAVASDGSLYITEDMGHRLVKLSASGTPLWTVGSPGVKGDWDYSNDILDNPADVALDSSGRVYVADRWHGRLQIYNSNGSYYATIGSLECPGGVGIAPNGYVYVANSCDHTIRVYNTAFSLIATLGEPWVSGSDNSHFSSPEDVAIDSAGIIYVADADNMRVQVFSASRTYLRTMGETGVSGDDFGHFGYPNGLFVDSARRLYVADDWNNQIQVFDSSGAYLTTIGGSWGNHSGQLRGPQGVTADTAGIVYVADAYNHRIQKFAPGVPGWVQTNINGFGQRENSCTLALAPFGAHLYAATYNWSGNGAQLWRRAAGGEWIQAMTGGFGDPRNEGIDHLIEFGGQLYAGTWTWDPATEQSNGGEVWRSSNGTGWGQVVSQGFGDLTNGEVFRFATFGEMLYASTASYTTTHGAEIWRSGTGNSGEWDRVVANGFGDADNNTILSFETFGAYLYAGTWNSEDGGAVWRSSSGDPDTWTQVNSNGFGDVDNYAVTALSVFGGHLYASTGHASGAGAQLWRCQTCDGSDWAKMVDNGFGNADSRTMPALEVFEGWLYFVIGNSSTGLEVWRTEDGSNWEQVGVAGFGDSNNYYTYWDNPIAVFSNRFFVGTCNGANGGEVWLYLPYNVYLPLVVRNH